MRWRHACVISTGEIFFCFTNAAASFKCRLVMSSGAVAEKVRGEVASARAECAARSRRLDAPTNAAPRNVRRERPGWEFCIGADSMSERAAKPELSSTLTCWTALPTNCPASKVVDCVSQVALHPSHGQTGSNASGSVAIIRAALPIFSQQHLVQTPQGEFSILPVGRRPRSGLLADRCLSAPHRYLICAIFLRGKR